MWRFALMYAGLLTAWLPAAAQSPAEAELLAAEDARFQAQLAQDAVALERAIASDVVYSHMTGKRENKSQVLQSFKRVPLNGITPSGRSARVIGEIGIVRGKLVKQLPERALTDGYLAVYALRDGRWQLLEWVSAAPQEDGK